MSITILEFSKSFADGKLSADEFANSYLELWKIERDKCLLTKDSGSLSECLSSIFCLADLYNPNFVRNEYEIDDVQLRTEVSKLIKKYGL
ncbi:MAG: colicin immunity domain-containing protein [Pseudomonadota bacterium]